MERDMNLGLDDPNDDLAVESLRLMKEDERTWYENVDIVKDKKSVRPLSLWYFLLDQIRHPPFLSRSLQLSAWPMSV
jgi:hypothetical protein